MVLNATGMQLSCLILFVLLTLTLKTTLHYFHYIPFHLKPSHMKLSRSIGDMDVGEFIVPVPYVKQVKELLELGESVGTQSRGLTKELISLLPVSKYKCSLFSRKKSRKERLRSKNNLQKAHNGWLLPLQMHVGGIATANKNDIDQHAVDTICALNLNSENANAKIIEYQIVAPEETTLSIQDIKYQVLTEVIVLERNGRVRHIGLGLSLKDRFGDSSQHYTSSQQPFKQEVEKLREEMQIKMDKIKANREEKRRIFV
ncbi:hypothetical protein PVK06_001346 [Gossypium arboreum]|uniref:Uncharacterized protein n=1 Tax=Gossypium arboreum TaxID=29729 RepID=A0ABR0R0S7_GOSAR|nr:hypothetical protein PVK06_001346 [Gossypium arboreum]